MGSGTSKQAENDISDMSLSEIRSNSASVKKPVQDENEKAMEEHQNYLVCIVNHVLSGNKFKIFTSSSYCKMQQQTNYYSVLIKLFLTYFQ